MKTIDIEQVKNGYIIKVKDSIDVNDKNTFVELSTDELYKRIGDIIFYESIQGRDVKVNVKIFN